MKKTLYLFLLIFLITGLINAQTDSSNKSVKKYRLFSSVGILVGSDLSSLSGDSPEDVSYGVKPGYMAGVSVEFNITKDFKLLFQPVYSMRFTKALFDTGEKELVDSMRLKFEYIRFPLTVKINALNGVTYFLGGIDPGYLLSSSLYDKEKINGEKDIINSLNRFDVSILFGFGVNFRLASNFLYLELRYEQSLLNMSKNEENGATNNLPARFRLGGFQLLTGFNFSL